MGPLERLVYVLALAWWRAYWEMRTAARLAWKEPEGEEALRRADRIHAAWLRLHAANAGGPKPEDPPPAGG